MNASRLIRIALMASISAAPLGAEAPGSIQDLGFISYEDAALAPNDSLNLDFAPAAALPSEPSGYARVEGCFSVATLSVESGARELAVPGRLSFACQTAPENAAVFGWIDGRWKKLESWRDRNGYINLSVSSLTTYAVVAPKPRMPPLASIKVDYRSFIF